jgi:hypothetical protein
MTSQGLAHSAGFLWAAVIGSLVFVAAGIFMLVFDPDEWLTAVATIVFFALCGASIGRMLVLRYRRAAR